MAKKDFSKSPAAAFMSRPKQDEVQAQDTHGVYNTDDTYYTDNKHNTYNNDQPDMTVDPKRRGRRATSDATERKTKRLNLLIKPSIFDDLQKVATMQQCSVNELICSVMQNYIRKHRDEIQKYDEIFGGDK